MGGLLGGGGANGYVAPPLKLLGGGGGLAPLPPPPRTPSSYAYAEGRVSSHSLVEIQLKRHKIKGHSFICTLQRILLSCDTVCDSAVFRKTAHDIYANGAQCICANSKCLLTISMQTALTQKGQAALWVTNGCTSMSKPITT